MSEGGRGGDGGVGSGKHQDWNPACKVYIGNLGQDTTKNELEDAFSKYGPLKHVWIARNPPGFAFVEFDDKRDALDAVSRLDGTRMSGNNIRVEMSVKRPGGYGQGQSRRGENNFRNDRNRSRSPGARRSRYDDDYAPRRGGRSPSRSRSRTRSPPSRSRRHRSRSERSDSKQESVTLTKFPKSEVKKSVEK